MSPLTERKSTLKKMLVFGMLSVACASLSGCELVVMGIILPKPCKGGIADAGICVEIKAPLCVCDYCGGYAEGDTVAGYHTYKNGGPSQGDCPGIGGPCTPSGLAHDHEHQIPPGMLNTGASTTSAQ